MSEVLTVPFSGNMKIGSLYNAYTGAVGAGLAFGDVKDPHVVTWDTLDCRYKRVKSQSEARDFLSVSSRLSLGAKAAGTGANLGYTQSYLSEETTNTSNLEILEKLHYKTKTLSIKPDAKPTLKWEEFVTKKFVPTHYVRSINYGAYLLASFRFQVMDHNAKDEKTFDASLGGSFMSVGGEVGAALKETVEKHQFISNFKVRYWSSVNVDGALTKQDEDGLQKLVDAFQKAIKDKGEGAGIPLTVDLMPLTYVYPDYPDKSKMDRTLELFLDKLQSISDVTEMVYNQAIQLQERVAIQPLPYNLADDLQDFIADTFPLVGDCRDAIARINFSAHRKEGVFHENRPEKNRLVLDGLDTKQCGDLLNLTYTTRFLNLRSVIEKTLARAKPALQMTLEYDTDVNKFMVTVLQARNLPARGFERCPDPYVVVNLLGQKSLHQERKTEHVDNNSDPVFNVSSAMEFEATFEELPKLGLQFDVFDKEMIGDDNFLVTAKIPLHIVRISSGQRRRDGLWVEMDIQE